MLTLEHSCPQDKYTARGFFWLGHHKDAEVVKPSMAVLMKVQVTAWTARHSISLA